MMLEQGRPLLWRRPERDAVMSPRGHTKGCSRFVGTQMRKQLILPGVGLGVREEFPGQKVASDGVLKYLWLLGKFYTSNVMTVP